MRNKQRLLTRSWTVLLALSALFLIVSCTGSRAVNESHTGQKVTNERVVVFPFENLSDDKDSVPQIMPLIKDRLARKGFDAVVEDALNRFFLKERVRSTAYISKDLAAKIKDEFNVNAVLLGTVNAFTSSENPVVGISARLIDTSDNHIVWADSSSAAGDDFVKILGLGKISDRKKLASKVVDTLFASFIAEPSRKESASKFRIAVMPFQNKSKKNEAGMIVTYLFLTELSRTNKFELLEYGDIRAMIVNLRIREKGELNLKSLEGNIDTLGLDGLIVGNVDLYSDSSDPSAPVEVDISARLVDVRKKRILWYDSCQLNGDDDIVFFDIGKVKSVDKLAQKAVSKLVKKMEKAEWRQ